MLAVVLAILAKLIVILRLGLRNISKRYKSHVFKDLHSITTHSDPISDKANSRFALKFKEALHINWRKSNLIG